MSQMNQDSATGIIVAAIVGAAVGAGVALLFAPASGKETREWLRTKGRDLKDRAATAIEEGKDTLRRAADDLSRDFEAGLNGIQDDLPLR